MTLDSLSPYVYRDEGADLGEGVDGLLHHHPITGERLPKPLQVVKPGRHDVAWHATSALNRASIKRLGLLPRHPTKHRRGNWRHERGGELDLQPLGVYVETILSSQLGHWWRVGRSPGRSVVDWDNRSNRQARRGADVWQVDLRGCPHLIVQDPKIEEAVVVLGAVPPNRLSLVARGLSSWTTWDVALRQGGE